MLPFHQMFRFYVRILCDDSTRLPRDLNIMVQAAEGDVFLNRFFIHPIFSQMYNQSSCSFICVRIHKPIVLHKFGG